MTGDTSPARGRARNARPSRPWSKSRRWFKLGIAFVVGTIVFAGLVYARALLTLDSSTFSRALIWVDADVDDIKRFPAREINAAASPYLYTKASGYPSGLPGDISLPAGHQDLESFLRSTETTAFIVVRSDRLLYEHYFNGHDHNSIRTSFSVAKSFASALVGIAIDKGIIRLDDPITEYLPELKERDSDFERITFRHLISMASGLRYEEEGTPWSDDAETYYAPDLRKLA